MKLKGKSALILIDIQQGFDNEACGGAIETIKRLKKMQRFYCKNGET